MTRRQFFWLAGVPVLPRQTLIVPVRLVDDGQVKWPPGEMERFRSRLWPEAVGDFRRCGIVLQTSLVTGAVHRPPGRQPVIEGLDRAALNVVLTNRIPMEWDSGRALCGVTMRYRGYHLCMIALDRAHGHQVPLLSVNTCTHEILHALLLDIFEARPGGMAGQAREFRVDSWATRLWLFHDGGPIRASARKYIELLGKDGGIDLK